MPIDGVWGWEFDADDGKHPDIEASVAASGRRGDLMRELSAAIAEKKEDLIMGLRGKLGVVEPQYYKNNKIKKGWSRS